MKDWRNWTIGVLLVLVLYLLYPFWIGQRDSASSPRKSQRMAKLVGIVDRPENMTEEEFDQWWFGTHAPIVKRMPGLRKYVLNKHVGPRSPHHGMAETWFDSLEDARKALESPVGQEAMEDAKGHVGKLDVLILEEYLIMDDLCERR